MVKKVEGNTTTKTQTEKKEKMPKAKRTAFNVKNAVYVNAQGQTVSAVNSDGLLIAMPKSIEKDGKVTYLGYDPRQNLPLKKSNFVDMAVYMLYQAYLARSKAATLIKIAADKEVKAERLQKFGDDITRRKVQKITRLREQLEALQKQLQDEGIDSSGI